MKKLIIVSLISLSMFVPQLNSISLAEYVQQEDVPKFLYCVRNGCLDLSGIGLTSLEGLQNIPKIDQVYWLDLSSNQLQMLSSDIFSGLPNLRILYLHKNQLKMLPVGIFSGLSKLSFLQLDGNQLQALPAGIFNGLDNLKTLDLEGNPFRGDFLISLPNIVRGILSLQFLDHRPIEDSALKSYPVYNPKTLQEITKEYAIQNLTPEQLEELAVAGDPAFDLLPLSQDKRQAILNTIEERKNIQFMAKVLVESLGQASSANK